MAARKRKSTLLSILVPYLSGSPCIEGCREYLEKNTRNRYELVTLADCRPVYRAFNEIVKLAKGDTLVFLNDDIFVAPDWDELIPEYTAERTILTTYLVESGRLPVNHRNIEMDFGKNPSEFEYERFAQFAESYAAGLPKSAPGLGWYMPFSCPREDFIAFPETEGLPNDSLLFGKFASLNYKFLRLRSFAYHFQAMSRQFGASI